jgi:16S rRNA A1518/A1519 N6-dimethyltransferase RsmA/KsgA/DIM1 with predicted DNA glycosylase/AP lyase activity
VKKRKGLRNFISFGASLYDVEYLFTVDENVFIPPPKVKSGVMRMRRKTDYSLPCGEKCSSS